MMKKVILKWILVLSFSMINFNFLLAPNELFSQLFELSTKNGLFIPVRSLKGSGSLFGSLSSYSKDELSSALNDDAIQDAIFKDFVTSLNYQVSQRNEHESYKVFLEGQVVGCQQQGIEAFTKNHDFKKTDFLKIIVEQKPVINGDQTEENKFLDFAFQMFLIEKLIAVFKGSAKLDENKKNLIIYLKNCAEIMNAPIEGRLGLFQKEQCKLFDVLLSPDDLNESAMAKFFMVLF